MKSAFLRLLRSGFAAALATFALPQARPAATDVAPGASAQPRAGLASFGTMVPRWGEWERWGDQEDGTYRNPVIPADYSDLDCTRVGSEYFAISSTFQFSPGMVILRSRDLVNWSIAGHAVADLTQIGPELNWTAMNRYGKGIWAGAIRHHAGRFWIYFGTPNEGFFLTSAARVEGPWAPLTRILEGPGWDDCSPFWDDDGQGYFVGTNFREGYRIHLWRLTPDGRGLVGASDRIIHQSKGSEANKLYKFGGRYYHFFSEVHPEGRVMMMERAAHVFGPYTEERQLKAADRAAMEPNQGGFVEGPQGNWYFLTHHGTGSWEGRCASLLPVTWLDGWPMVGAIEADGLRHMVWAGAMPARSAGRTTPQADDDFADAVLGPQWEWNHQPRADKWSLRERPGWLRLHAFRPLVPGDLLKAGNTLTQRSFRTARDEVTVELDLGGMADGQQAGLCHFAKVPSAIGVVCSGDIVGLIWAKGGATHLGPPIRATRVWLRSAWGLEGMSRYSYSLNGADFHDFGEACPLTWSYYRGDRIGLYTYNDRGEAGFVDARHFSYRY